MDAGSIFLILALALVVGLFIARPFLQARPSPSGPRLEDDSERSSLLAERDRMLTSLQELDFDHRLGKIPEEDYPAMRDSLKTSTAQVLRRLDDLQCASSHDVDDEIEKVIAARRADAAVARQTPSTGVLVADDLEEMIASRKRSRQEKSAGFCPKCGKPAQKSDKFCSRCGTALTD